MRFVRSDVRHHVASWKNDHGPSYRRYRASQRRSCLKIDNWEIFGIAQFRPFQEYRHKTDLRGMSVQCPPSGVKQTSCRMAATSEFDTMDGAHSSARGAIGWLC
jgi:hypothetical protein